MPSLGEFAAMWGFLLLTMFLPIRLKRGPRKASAAIAKSTA